MSKRTRRAAALTLAAGAMAIVVPATSGGAAPAKAKPDFTVIAKSTGGHPVGHRFFDKGVLLRPNDHRIRGHYKSLINRQGRVRAANIFPRGKIKTDGTGRTATIVGGTRAFAGATGTIHLKNLSHSRLQITFHLDS